MLEDWTDNNACRTHLYSNDIDDKNPAACRTLTHYIDKDNTTCRTCPYIAIMQILILAGHLPMTMIPIILAGHVRIAMRQRAECNGGVKTRPIERIQVYCSPGKG